MDFKEKVTGNALIYTVMMSLVIFLLLGLVLSRGRMEHARLHVAMERDWIRDQARSAAALLGENEALLGKEGVTGILLPGIPARVERISRAWGLFDVELIVSETAHFRDTTAFLCGRGDPAGDSTALYFPDEAGNYLSVAGNTELRGICYLPSLGARKGYVQGTGYYKDSVVHGETRFAGKSLPAISSFYLERLEKITRVDESHELVSPATRSFTMDAVTVYSASPVTLFETRLEGNIRVVAAGRIEVDSTCLLRHCLLVAPVIKIGRGFKGKVQLFASDSIVIDTGATLLYPSVVCLNATGKEAFLETRHGVSVSGMILLTGNARSLYLMRPGSVLCGQLYNSGVTQLEGHVYGSAYLRGMRFYNEWGEYENIIKDGVIDNSVPAKNRALVDLFHSGSREPLVEVVW
jgi:hypothetical protein